MHYESVYQPDPNLYQKIWPLIKDFATKPNSKMYVDLFAQRIATAGKSAKFYALTTVVYIIVSSVVMAALGNTYTKVTGVITTITAENLPLILYSNFGSMVGMFILFILFAGLVHFSSTFAMRGNGEFDKIIFALFAVLGLFSLIGIPSYLVLFVLAQLGSPVYGVVKIIWILFLLIQIVYLLYCFVLSVKTVYHLGWVRAVGGGIIVPLAILGSCIGALVLNATAYN